MRNLRIATFFLLFMANVFTVEPFGFQVQLHGHPITNSSEVFHSRFNGMFYYSAALPNIYKYINAQKLRIYLNINVHSK